MSYFTVKDDHKLYDTDNMCSGVLKGTFYRVMEKNVYNTYANLFPTFTNVV